MFRAPTHYMQTAFEVLRANPCYAQTLFAEALDNDRDEVLVQTCKTNAVLQSTAGRFVSL